MGTALAAGLSEAEAKQEPEQRDPANEMNQAVQLTDDVFFHQGDIDGRGHCNNGWIIFKDYVLVIDANYPSGAQNILPKIRAITPKPIRFAFDTHHHGDHAYGNQVMVDNGAKPIAHTGVLDEMKRYETGYFDSKPGRWEETAKSRPDVAKSRLKPPSVLFPRELYFDDGEHRVELIHLGIAHTHGDAVAWLPKQRILFTGDTCVNGAYNFVGDGDIEKWITTLSAAKGLNARAVCPGHGPHGLPTLLDDQQAFFSELRKQVGALLQARKSGREVQASVASIGAALKLKPQITRYVGDGLEPQIEKVYQEMTGKKFAGGSKTAHAARDLHRHAHALQSV